jgi:hypothetical protein
MNIRVFDHRNSMDVQYQRADDYLGHFRPAAPSLIVQGGRIPWSSDLLSAAVLHAGPVGVVFYHPWAPGAKKRHEVFKSTFPSATDFNPELLVIGPTSHSFPLGVLELRRTLGAHTSGLWLIGSGSDAGEVENRLSTPATRGEPMSFIAEIMADVLPFCLCLDEGDLSTLFLQLTERTASDAAAIKEFVSGVARPK